MVLEYPTAKNICLVEEPGLPEARLGLGEIFVSWAWLLEGLRSGLWLPRAFPGPSTSIAVLPPALPSHGTGCVCALPFPDHPVCKPPAGRDPASLPCSQLQPGSTLATCRGGCPEPRSHIQSRKPADCWCGAAAGVVNQADEQRILLPGYFTTPGLHHTHPLRASLVGPGGQRCGCRATCGGLGWGEGLCVKDWSLWFPGSPSACPSGSPGEPSKNPEPSPSPLPLPQAPRFSRVEQESLCSLGAPVRCPSAVRGEPRAPRWAAAMAPPCPPRPCSSHLARLTPQLLLPSSFPEIDGVQYSGTKARLLPLAFTRFPCSGMMLPFPPHGPFFCQMPALRESMCWFCQLCLHNILHLPTPLTTPPPTAASLAWPPPRGTCGGP